MEVRRHEGAHKAAAGRYARGAAKYKYEKGPDGRLYAVDGEVQIDLSSVPNDPEGTIRKMEAIQRAANAPAQPSSSDRQVAARAAQIEQQARAELSRQQGPEQGLSASDDIDGPGQVVDLLA